MKNNSLDEIVKCNIEISSPASNEETFDTILIVVEQPEGDAIDNAFEISKAADLLDYGYTEEDEAYTAASVAFIQNPAPSKLVVYPRKKESGAYETIPKALANALAEKSFYGFHLTSFKTAAELQAASDWAEVNEKLFGFEYDDFDECPVKADNAYRTFGVFAGLVDSEDAAKNNAYLALGLMAKVFGYEPGSETWAFKEVSGMVPAVLSTAQKTALENNNISSYLRYAGVNVTIGGKVMGGEWIDVIRFRDWLKADIQSRVFNVIKLNRKVEFTDSGIGMIEGAIEASLKAGQEVGGIADTSYDAEGNAIPGYTVVVPRENSFTEEQKKSRKLSGCSWTAKLAGAIHAVEIGGYLTL